MARPVRLTDAEFDRQHQEAGQAAEAADRVEPRAASIRHDEELGLILVHLRSGFVFGFPPASVPGLEKATPTQLSDAVISPSGDGLHWEAVDVHASLTGLIRDALRLSEWAPRILGQIRSAAKARAARENGLKGGRPRRGESRRKPAG